MRYVATSVALSRRIMCRVVMILLPVSSFPTYASLPYDVDVPALLLSLLRHDYWMCTMLQLRTSPINSTVQ